MRGCLCKRRDKKPERTLNWWSLVVRFKMRLVLFGSRIIIDRAAKELSRITSKIRFILIRISRIR